MVVESSLHSKQKKNPNSTISLHQLNQFIFQGRTSVSKQVSFLEAFFDLLDITNQGEAGSPDVTVLPKMTRYVSL